MNRLPTLATYLVILIASGPVSMAQPDTLTILHINDTHSTLAPTGPRDSLLRAKQGGIARAATVIGLTKMTETNVLTLHGGDVFIGDLFFTTYFGVPEIRLMVQLGFDAMAIGNHEFDLAPAALAEALDSGFVDGRFPILSANLQLQDTSLVHLRSYIQPYTIKQFGSIKVGIFGMTTPSTNQFSQPAPAVISDSLAEIASEMVSTLKGEGCDVVILLSHLGLGLDKIVAASTPGIDVVIGAHDHYLLSQPLVVADPAGNTTWITQVGAFYQHIGKMRLTVEGGKVRLLEYAAIPLDESIPEEPTIKAVVDQLIAGIEERYGPLFSQEITNAADNFQEEALDLTSDGNKDTPIGNIVTDALRAATGKQIAVEPGGGTAQPFFKGPIVPADAFRVVGYGFNTTNGLGYRVVTFDIQGGALLAGLEFGLSDIESNDELLMQVSGMSYSYNPDAAPGSRLLSARVGDLPLDPEATYSVATNEFVVAFLQFLQIPFSNIEYRGDSTEFHYLAGYIASFDTIRPRVEGRVVSQRAASVGQRGGEITRGMRMEVYPNPSRGSGVINFDLPKSGRVRVDLYDNHGSYLATLIDEDRGAGTHSFEFASGNLAAGIYNCRLRSGDLSRSIKVLIVR